MYTLILGGDDEGLYLNGTQVASAWALRKIGHETGRMVGYSQSFLGQIHKAVMLYFN